MIGNLPCPLLPQWLQDMDDTLAAISPREVLRDSVYYPASGLDGDPVKLLGQHFHSFVYADYGLARDAIIDTLPSFRGYGVLGYREVAPSELAPGEWSSNPIVARDRHPHLEDFVKPPFAIWAVLQREFGFASDHGPDRFSLLFIGGDGVATFDALYRQHRLAPAVVALIQPGHGFGGNWTDFTDPDEPFAHAVMSNPSGTPTWLLEGGAGDEAHYEKPCWPSFSTPVWTGRRSVEGTLRLWRTIP